jgi:NADH-quinone oxidoreductase subunit B
MEINQSIENKGYIITKAEALFNWLVGWGRKNAIWPMPFGTACCAIELMASAATRYDISRFGAEVMRFSPRQADLLIVGGRVCLKQMPVLMKIYKQMPEPKWVVSMGACASCGGVFNTYTMIQGVDRFIPVDVYIPGCPPRPENVIDALMMIQKKIEEGIAPKYTTTDTNTIQEVTWKHTAIAVPDELND